MFVIIGQLYINFRFYLKDELRTIFKVYFVDLLKDGTA